jgi:hypothetical protein
MILVSSDPWFFPLRLSCWWCCSNNERLFALTTAEGPASSVHLALARRPPADIPGSMQGPPKSADLGYFFAGLIRNRDPPIVAGSRISRDLRSNLLGSFQGCMLVWQVFAIRVCDMGSILYVE